MNSRQRVLTALSHAEPDQVPVDLGGTENSTIARIAYLNLRDYLGLPAEPQPYVINRISSVLFAADPPPPARVALKAARLIDGKGGRPVGPVVVVIENDRIVAAGVAVAIPPGTRVVDLGGATLLPGLIEMHDHLTSIPEDSGYKALGVSVPREAMHGVAGSRKTLEAGFTTVRNVGAAGYADVALRDAIVAGEVPGPRLAVSGRRSASPEATATTTSFPPNTTTRRPVLRTARGKRGQRCARSSSTAPT